MVTKDGVLCSAVTDSTATSELPETPPNAAVMVTRPGVNPVTVPLVSTVAMVLSDDVHVEAVSIACVVPSLKVPRALKTSVVPEASPATAGVTAIEFSVAGDTVSGADPFTPPKAAEIEVIPAPTPVAIPRVPDWLLMVAAGGLLLA